MKSLFYLAFIFITFQSNAQTGIFINQSDIGSPKLGGSTKYNPADQSYTLKGAGYNIWFGRDEFQYAYKKLKGDFILTANFEFLGAGTDPHRKIGWMVRASTEPDAAHVSAVLHGDGLTVLQWRVMRGAFMRDPEDEIFSPKKYYSIIQLERKAKTIIMRAAHPYEPLQTIGSTDAASLPDEVLAGLFICSHNADVTEQARVWNVRIDQPVPETYNAYKEGFIACRLETMTIADGNRKIIYESKTGFEAPNWMRDGKRLLYNKDGSIYTIAVNGGEPEKLNTGSADHNNNDHGISFDGKTLAISHHRRELAGGGSTIYTLPVTGGIPTLLTEQTPSYWHGWSPNGKEILFVANRNGKMYDIYKMSSAGGPEIQLTHNNNYHVDGPEYSPDGKYIYFNSSQSGTMQLWRMKPDGSANEQITFDDYNNWFPHISPDGKWIAFISFDSTIDVNDHPPLKRIMLRLMPVSGGAPKVIAWLYGGQGTMNVPSWSPDSKQIAFVSYVEK